jgi:hypothetical protein
VGWGPVFLALSGITISSFSPGSLCQKPLLHCRFIQCRLFFYFLLQCHTQLVETCEMWRKNCIHLHGIHLSITEMKCVPYWVNNGVFKEGILNIYGDIMWWVVLQLGKKHRFLFMTTSVVYLSAKQFCWKSHQFKSTVQRNYRQSLIEIGQET